MSRNCNREGFCFVFFKLPSSIGIVWKCLNIFLLEWSSFKQPSTLRRGLLTQGIQMSWVRSKYSASLRKGESTLELGRSSAPLREETPHFSVDDQGKCSAGFWVWEKAAESFYWWNKPGKTTCPVLWGWARSECPVKASPRGTEIHFWEEHDESKLHDK